MASPQKDRDGVDNHDMKLPAGKRLEIAIWVQVISDLTFVWLVMLAQEVCPTLVENSCMLFDSRLHSRFYSQLVAAQVPLE